MKKKIVKEVRNKDIVFILDRSGSMYDMVSDTIGGYNSYLEKFKNENANITTILFDDDYEVIGERVPVKECKKLDEKTYYTRGCTALYDAIGKTIQRLDKEDTDDVLFIITTDGYENASREFNRDNIKRMIKKHSSWEFIYLGADIDSFSAASSIGISSERVANYQRGSAGVKKMFGAVNKISEYLFEESMDECGASWKAELEEYISDNE